MCRLAVILLFCGSIFIAVDCAPLDFESNSAANFNVVVVEDFNKYLKENPDVKLVQKLDKLENRIQIRYTLGSRVSGECKKFFRLKKKKEKEIFFLLESGDRLVGDTSNSQSWSSPQDVVLTINYPRTGVGAVISFVQVIVGQVGTFLVLNLLQNLFQNMELLL